MVPKSYADAYQEVIEVLRYSEPNDVNKIPIGKIRFFIEHMNKMHNFKINTEKTLDEQELSEEARAILANLYKDYWATDYEKQRIEAKENYDLEQIAKEKYSTDSLFKKREVKAEAISHNENSMIIAKKEKWYKKIFNSIKKFFSKKNNTNLQISYEEYKRIFEKDKDGCFINLIIPKDEQNEELNLIGKKPSDFSIDEIVRMKKYSEQLYKKVDKKTIY